MSRSAERRERRSLAVEDRLQCARQVFELGASEVLQEVLSEAEHMHVRAFPQRHPAVSGELRERAPFVTLDDAALDEAPALELIDRPGDPAGRKHDP